MKKLLLLLFVLHFVSYGQKADGLEICFEVQKSLKGFASDKEADDALEEILAVIGAAKNFYLIPCGEINNALALTYKGERFILYDKDFIDKINKATNDWSGKFVLAHEVGHHINGHTRDFLIASVLDDQTKEKQREEELEADEFAGFIVAKLGASFFQIKELMDTIAPEKDDKYSTHPSRSKRIEAIKRGFDNAKVNPGNSSNEGGITKTETNKNQSKPPNELSIMDFNLIEDSKSIPAGITAMTIMESYINAIGGLNSIENVKTILQYYDVTIEDAPFKPKSVLKSMAPNKISMEMSVEGMGTIMKQKFDGTKGFTEQQGVKRALSNDDISKKINIKGLFPEAHYSSFEIEPVSVVTFENFSDVYKVKVRGIINSYRYYSVDSGLLLRIEEQDKETKTITLFSNYRFVGGVLLPYTKKIQTSTTKGSQVIELNATNVLINSGVSSKDFKR